jgi:hypothetical protein
MVRRLETPQVRQIHGGCFRTSQGQPQAPHHEIHCILLRAAQATATHQGNASPPVVGGRQVCGEPNESAMSIALFTSLNTALGPWLPLLGLLLGVGGPLCIYLQGRAATQVAKITAGAQVEVARVAAAGGGQVPEVPKTAERQIRKEIRQLRKGNASFP